jgi:hypothetical protein
MIYIKRAESCAVEAADCKVAMVAQGQGGKGARRERSSDISIIVKLRLNLTFDQSSCYFFLSSSSIVPPSARG